MFAQATWVLVALGVIYLSQALVTSPTFQKICYSIITYIPRRFHAWSFLFQGANMITEEYKKARGTPFEVAGPDHNHVFITSPKYFGEIRTAGRDKLSLFGATKQMFQPVYTMLGHNWIDERGAEGTGYVRAVGTLFPRQLTAVMPDMLSIVQRSFEDFSQEHWNWLIQEGNGPLPAYKLNKTILCKLNAFCFFGQELAGNDFFLEKIFEYNEIVIFAGELLRVLPKFMKWMVGPYVARKSSVQDQVYVMIDDLVARRMELNKLRESGEDSSEPPCDIVQYIIDTAPKKLGWTSRRITYEIIAIWFGSVHALSATVTYVLFDLYEHPEYIKPLRAEVESSEFDYFMKTTKGLPLLDSFIKESSRVNPIESISGRRQALKDFAFSDGTLVKKGDWTCVPVKAILADEAFFPQASTFQGFRFVPHDRIPADTHTVSQPEGPSKYSDLSENYHAWGISGIVCPGRFYAAISMKLIMACILKDYDISLLDRKKDRSITWRSYVLPREDVLMEFTPRNGIAA